MAAGRIASGIFLPSEGRKRFFVMKLRPHFGNLIPGSLKKYAGTVIPGTKNLCTSATLYLQRKRGTRSEASSEPFFGTESRWEAYFL